jgi:hypothetical protein
MPSQSLQVWESVRAISLDEIENAHRSVGGTGPGRRYATQQINQAYAMLLSSHFQGLCRDLHTECLLFMTRSVTPATLHEALREEFMLNRKLDRGNPNPGNIGADFIRLGVDFWPEVEASDPRNRQRRELLEELNTWRNAIAHQDFDLTKLGGSRNLRLEQVRNWRNACDGLAITFDDVMRNYLESTLGRSPW